jgi:hypothetical protein
MKNKISLIKYIFLILFLGVEIFPQSNPPVFDPPAMDIDVGGYTFFLQRKYGMNINEAGGLSVQPSWNYAGKRESFNWPRDLYRTDMMTNIFQPLVFTDGVIDPKGVKKVYSVHPTRVDKVVNLCEIDWGKQFRRYRPPHITVNGIRVDPPFEWYVDRNLEADMKVDWEDVYENGFRSHVTTYAFADPDNDHFMIWKATHKFTGEVVVSYKRTGPGGTFGKTDTMPSQTVKFYWPFEMSFGPTKLGYWKIKNAERDISTDAMTEWFARPSVLVPGQGRDTLKVAYYWNTKLYSPMTYTNGSSDDSGDPDLKTGYLYSTQIPGYALLFASKSPSEVNTDDLNQPFALGFASIRQDKWVDKKDENAILYSGRNTTLGRFPHYQDLLAFRNANEQGPMRFIVNGPYELTLDRAKNRADSITFVYAIGAGSIGADQAKKIGADWFSKTITDQQKNDAFIEPGKDSLFNVLDRAKYAWTKINNGVKLPAAPPPPDIVVENGPDQIVVSWSYPEGSYFQDAVTGVDDWAEWRVYRKKGTLLTFDPLDENATNKWELIFTTTDRNVKQYLDKNVIRGVDYYYAVTAVDNGSQNTTGYKPGQALESSKYVTMSQLPAVSVKSGMNTTKEIRVVPNPATRYKAGAALNQGTPDRISFFNLPVSCKLNIYTESGELVWTKDHYASADDYWEQKTASNQYAVSGLYILAVTDCKDVNGKSLDNQFVKFVIVR